MHLAPLIKDLSMILVLAAISGLVFRRLKLPVVIGYLLAGFIVGPNSASFPRVHDLPNVKTWAEIGVIILMFSLGLEFSFRRLMRVGLPIVLTGLLEVLGMLYLGFGVSKLMGWSDTSSLFVGAILALSSTTIIAKNFEELKLKQKKFAEFVYGLCIIEDLIAIVLIVLLATPKPEGGISFSFVMETTGTMFVVIGSWFVFGYYFIPRIMKVFASWGNDESLLIFSLALCFLLAFFATEFQFSSSLGAFIMGSIVSESVVSEHVNKLIRPIRDLFLAIFFVSVGIMIDPLSLGSSWKTVLLMSVFVVVGKVVLVTVGSLLAGQRLRDGVRSGFSMAQIGEFSFILATLGVQKGELDSEVLSLAVSVAMITILLSPAMLGFGQRVADFLDEIIPKKLSEFLLDYQNWWQKYKADTKNKNSLYKLAASVWILNGLVIVTIFALASEALLPYLRELGWFHEAAPLMAWSAAFFLSLPFIWGMFWSFNRAKRENSNELVFLILKYGSRVGLLFLVGTLSGAFFEAKLALLVIVATTLATIVVLYRRLEMAYGEFESNFMHTFKRQQESDRLPFTGSFPWDAHLSKIQISADSFLAGKTLLEADIRRNTGCSIVNVRRATKDIVAPLGTFRIFPEDELLVLGTDEQLQKLMTLTQPSASEGPQETQEFKIQPILVSENHNFCGKKISELRLHENFSSLLVGIEREGARTMSPSPDFVINPGDFVWLVGPTSRLDQV